MPLRLETTAPPGLDAAWPITPRKDESHFRRVYKWDNAGFVPPGLCEKMIAAFQGVAGCRYLRDASGDALACRVAARRAARAGRRHCQAGGGCGQGG